MIDSLLKLVSKHEGREANVYLDSKGIKTVGVGHNIEAHPLPSDMVPPLTDDQIDQLLQQDLDDAMSGLLKALPWAVDLDPVRQAVLGDLSFNMGLPTLLQFHHTLGFIQEGNYAAASAGMLASLWAKQVGKRAQEDAQMMVSGEWPA
jgi:lysozyme